LTVWWIGNGAGTASASSGGTCWRRPRELPRVSQFTRRALVSPLKWQKEHPPEAGGHPVTLRQMGPGRRELLEAWAQKPDLVWHVLKGRVRIKNTFNRVNFAGLGHLPPFVRGIGRVTRWAGAKLILNHALLRAKGLAPLPPARG
jgi:hypothetical protein